jgi:hypothetical protein
VTQVSVALVKEAVAVPPQLDELYLTIETEARSSAQVKRALMSAPLTHEPSENEPSASIVPLQNLEPMFCFTLITVPVVGASPPAAPVEVNGTSGVVEPVEELLLFQAPVEDEEEEEDELNEVLFELGAVEEEEEDERTPVLDEDDVLPVELELLMLPIPLLLLLPLLLLQSARAPVDELEDESTGAGMCVDDVPVELELLTREPVEEEDEDDRTGACVEDEEDDDACFVPVEDDGELGSALLEDEDEAAEDGVAVDEDRPVLLLLLLEDGAVSCVEELEEFVETAVLLDESVTGSTARVSRPQQSSTSTAASRRRRWERMVGDRMGGWMEHDQVLYEYEYERRIRIRMSASAQTLRSPLLCSCSQWCRRSQPDSSARAHTPLPLLFPAPYESD